jgi:ABC-2 type transport system ATP-binding protein
MCDRTLIIQSGKLIGEKQTRTEEETTEAKKQVVVIQATPMEKVISILQTQQIVPLHSNQTSLEIEVERDEIPKLVKNLVAEDVSIFAVETRVKSLEDEFLEITGGKSVD